MKTITKTTIAALAISVLSVQSAMAADCPSNSQSFDNVTHDLDDIPWVSPAGMPFFLQNGAIPGTSFEGSIDGDGPLDDCWAPAALGSQSAATGTIVVNPQNDDHGIYQRSISGVLGPNNSAFGNGSSVYTIDGGSDGVGDDPDTIEDESANDQLLPVSNGTAIGAKSHVSHNNSTALGAGAQSTDDHQVTLGTEEDTVKAPGITSAKSEARQSGPTELVTTDSEGNLASDGGATNAAISNNAGGISTNADAIAANSAAINENSEGVAIAMAMPDSWLSDQENFAIAGGFGGFNGETAFGAIGTARIYGGFSAYAGGGISTSGNEWGWKVGARAGF